MGKEINSFTYQALQFSPVVQKTLWKWKYDIALLVASACCFGLFLERSLNEDHISGIGGPIAIMTQGRAERKASGTHLFVDVGPNSNLFNLDAIWVGKDGEATINLEGNLSIKLAEQTLIILKRPFKHKEGRSFLEEEIKVVKGKVQTPERAITPEAEVLPSLIPEDLSKGKKVPIKLYPKDNSVIYMRPERDIPLAFAWPTDLTGYIVIQNKGTGRRNYAELQNQRHFAAKLEQTGSYFWQVTDSEHRPMLGPYTFTIKHLDNEVTKQLLKNGTSANTDVYW